MDKKDLLAAVTEARATTKPEQAKNFLLDRPDEEIMAAVSNFQEVLHATLGDFSELKSNGKQAYSKLAGLSSMLREEPINIGLLGHVKSIILAWESLEEMIVKSGRFTKEEVMMAGRQVYLHDIGRSITHHSVLHQKIEEYWGIPNRLSTGKIVESEYPHFDTGKAKELAPLSALFSLIDTCAKDPVVDPADFLGVPQEMRNMSFSSTRRAVLAHPEKWPSYQEGNDQFNKRDHKLKLSLLLVLEDVEKHFPELGIGTWNDLTEKIVKPIATKVAAVDTKEFFGIQKAE